MAAEMLEKILEAEKQAKEKLEKTEAEARRIIELAYEEAGKLVNDAKLGAERDRKQKISECRENAEKMSLEGRSDAQKICAEMEKSCFDKSDVCTKLIIEKLIS